MRDQFPFNYFYKEALRAIAVPLFLMLEFGACSITAVRPAQEMSNMEVAIRAAKEVNADVLSPELYRKAQETSLEARHNYRLKNFQEAKEQADEARTFAEKAEFESIANGGKREFVPEDPLAEPSYPVDNIQPHRKEPSPAGAGTPTIGIPSGVLPSPGKAGATP